MSFEEVTELFPWYRYSKKLQGKIDRPRNAGYFTQADADARNVRLVEAQEGSVAEDRAVRFYWFVDKEDGTIIDVKYQVYGQSALIGAAEAAAELCIGKNYDQASRLTTDLMDKQVRDKPDVSAFPREAYPHLNLVLEAIETAAHQCTDIPLSTSYIVSPVPSGMEEGGEGYPGWDVLPLKEKLGLIEKVLDEDVRPYIALDAGGVAVLNLIDDREVIISYQGACTSCYSSIGTTLSYIQQILRNKVSPNLTVTPDIDFKEPYPS